MKKLLVLFALSLITLNFAQISDTAKIEKIFLVELNTGSELFGNIDENCILKTSKIRSSDFLKDNTYLIEDYILCRNDKNIGYFFKIYDSENSFFVSTKDVKVVTENEDNESAMVFFSQKNEIEKKSYKIKLEELLNDTKDRIKREENYEEIKKDEIILIEGEKVYKNSIILNDFSFPSEYSLVGFSFSVYNNSKNKIKYVTAVVSAYNDVNDRIYTLSGQTSKSFKGIGPIEPYEIGGWSFETIWEESIFGFGRINSITVEYFNGTKKTYTNMNAITLPDEYHEAVERVEKYLKENSLE